MGSESAGAKNFVAWAGSGWVAALQGLDRQRPGTNAGLRLRGTCVMTQGRHREAPVGRAQIVDFQNSWPSHDAREHSTASKGAMGGHRFCSAQHSSTRPLSSAHANIRSLSPTALGAPTEFSHCKPRTATAFQAGFHGFPPRPLPDHLTLC